MLRLTGSVLCVLAAGLTVAGVSAASAPARLAPVHHPAVGIGDNKSDMFTDPRFRALRMSNVRYDMSWDALSVTYQRQEVTTWMNAAKRDGLSVLVTIDHSYRVIHKRVKVHGKTKLKAFSQSRVMPSTAQYIAAFKAFRKRFPWVKQFVTWDETNCYCEVTYNKETQIAAFYRGMRNACSSCTLLAAEFLDTDKRYAVPMTTWVSKLDKALGYQPGYWGLNDYEDANHLASTQTRQLLGLVRGRIWLAETGGIVNRHNGTKNPGFPQNAAHAAKVDTYILDKIGSLSPRIQRIYLYEWDAKTRVDSWDSALISFNTIPRPGYAVLANTLKAWGVKPNCSISRVPPSCPRLPAGH
jgi:hypothetical protein